MLAPLKPLGRSVQCSPPLPPRPHPSPRVPRPPSIRYPPFRSFPGTQRVSRYRFQRDHASNPKPCFPPNLSVSGFAVPVRWWYPSWMIRPYGTNCRATPTALPGLLHPGRIPLSDPIHSTMRKQTRFTEQSDGTTWKTFPVHRTSPPGRVPNMGDRITRPWSVSCLCVDFSGLFFFHQSRGSST